jgi:isovaleryl-CoA dehydrogenase
LVKTSTRSAAELGYLLFVHFTPAQAEYRARVQQFCFDLSAVEDTFVVHSATAYERLAASELLAELFINVSGSSTPNAVNICSLLDLLAVEAVPVGGLGTTVVANTLYQSAAPPEVARATAAGFQAGEIYALAFSEEAAGSDLSALECAATPMPEGWRLDGQKRWCSNGLRAARILVLARSGTALPKNDGLSIFDLVVPAKGATLRRTNVCGGIDVADLKLERCLLPHKSLIGERNRGWALVSELMCIERLVLAAISTGAAQRAIDSALRHVKSRKQFGRTIGSNQVVRHRMADLFTELEATRCLLYGVAAAMDHGPLGIHFRGASMAKLRATELAKEANLTRVQLHGATGVLQGSQSHLELDRSLVTTIYGGTNELQREIIGMSYGL